MMDQKGESNQFTTEMQHANKLAIFARSLAAPRIPWACTCLLS